MKIKGLLGIPRKTGNNNFYWSSELARGHGVQVPIRWNHIKENNGIIGTSTLLWDSKLQQLNYEGEVTNPKVQALLLEHKNDKTKIPFKTSLGATAQSEQILCHSNGKECMSAAIDVKFNEMSIVGGGMSEAGIPEANINIMESVECLSCGTDKIILYGECLMDTSISTDLAKSESMTEENVTTNTVTTEVVKTEAVKPAEVSTVATTTVAPTIQIVEKIVEVPKFDEALVNKLVEERVAEATKKIEESISSSYEKKHEVSESVQNAKWTESKKDEHIKLMERVLSGESISIKIDKEEFINAHSVYQPSVFAEAVSTSGTIPGINTGSQIVVLPGGILVRSIRPWVEVKTIAQGEDKVRFYTLTIPAFADITEHVSTEITPATHTLTGFDLAADTPRGFRQNVLKTELEKYPADLLEKIRETARIRALEDEIVNVLDVTAASITVDFGANHFSASDGTLVTTTTLEDSAGEFKAIGLETAKQRLQEQGHEAENGAAVAAISPRAQKTLIQDTALVRFMQQADPSISRLGRISMYFGIEIFITNALSIDNNAKRNIVFMKGLAFGLATARDLELEFDKNINRQSVDIVATHRINSVIKDATAYVILSSKND